MAKKTFKIRDHVICHKAEVDGMNCKGRHFEVIDIDAEHHLTRVKCIDPKFKDDTHYGRNGWWIQNRDLVLNINGIELVASI